MEAQSSDSVMILTAPAERTPWVCAECGRQVPRSVDMCRCGAVRTVPREESSDVQVATRPIDRTGQQWYLGLSGVIAVVTFFASWTYCVATYGFLIGVSLGWFPSLIVAAVAAILWPFIAIAVFVGFVIHNEKWW